MKKFFFLAALIASAFTAASCSDDNDDNNMPEQPTFESDTYTGTLSTTNLSDTSIAVFTANDIVFNLNETDNPSPQKDIVDLVMNGVQFAKEMPGMNISISNVPETAEDVYSLSEGKATTTMMGKTIEVDVTNVVITEVNNNLAVSFNISYGSQAYGMNDYNIVYTGTEK